jgi:hypothetical protein
MEICCRVWDRASPKCGSLLGSRGFAEQFCAHLARGRTDPAPKVCRLRVRIPSHGGLADCEKRHTLMERKMQMKLLLAFALLMACLDFNRLRIESQDQRELREKATKQRYLLGLGFGISLYCVFIIDQKNYKVKLYA